jgi:hypothetical protein
MGWMGWSVSCRSGFRKDLAALISGMKELGVVVHAFNPSTWEAESEAEAEAEAGGFLSSRPAWSTKWVPVQPGLQRNPVSKNQKPNKTKQKNNPKKQTTTPPKKKSLKKKKKKRTGGVGAPVSMDVSVCKCLHDSTALPSLVSVYKEIMRLP